MGQNQIRLYRTCNAVEKEDFESLNDSSSNILTNSVLRKVSSCQDAIEALDTLEESIGNEVDQFLLKDADCRKILSAALERGNVGLALSIFESMKKSRTAGTNGTMIDPLVSLDQEPSENKKTRLKWPAPTIETSSSLIIGLSRILRTRDAISLVEMVHNRGIINSINDVDFGHVVIGATGQPLAVVQPHEGIQMVADATTRYEYELYSGEVVDVSSESLLSEIFNQANIAYSIAQKVGAWVPKQIGAVHTLVVETPNGQQRTFRFGTETGDRPAKVGDRVTVVCSPQNSELMRKKLIPPSPPNTAPGQALILSNHSTRASQSLMRPPRSTTSSTGFLPSWVIPAVLLFAATETVSSMIDPLLPWAIAGATTTTIATGIAGTTIVIPRIKQLPEKEVEVQASRQKLLRQYTSLDTRARVLVKECKEDVMSLARLWQLLGKMGALSSFTFEEKTRVGTSKEILESEVDRLETILSSLVDENASHRHSSSLQDDESSQDPDGLGMKSDMTRNLDEDKSFAERSTGPYQARQQRVLAACSSLEARLRKRIELLERYASVMAMIEIEVEMETNVPAAEIAGIEAAVIALEEADEIMAEWVQQASAADEVEKLLRA